jgi:hypothetical protein
MEVASVSHSIKLSSGASLGRKLPQPHRAASSRHNTVQIYSGLRLVRGGKSAVPKFSLMRACRAAPAQPLFGSNPVRPASLTSGSSRSLRSLGTGEAGPLTKR